MKNFAIGLLVAFALLMVVAFAPPAAKERLSVLCATETGNCLEAWSGTDIEIYSDRGSTKVLDIEGSTGTITMSDGDLVIADDLRITAQTTITATDATTITLTGGFQQILAASEVTPTFAAGTEGDIAILVAHSTGPINIVDGGTASLAGAVALGQYDSITLIYDGTAAAWVELTRSNN